MKKILLATASLVLVAALGGCVGYPGGYSSGAWAGYDGGFDSGFQGYERPVTWDDYNPQVYAPIASYVPPPYGYPAQPGYPANYGPQSSGWYSTYYCPPQMGGY
jgi:hypothetical protein